MPAITNPNTINERRKTLAAEIKTLADRQENWTDADRQNWETLNAEYDQVSATFRNLIMAEGIEPIGGDVMENFEKKMRAAKGNDDGNGHGLQLRDAATGRSIRAFTATDRLCSAPVNVGDQICDIALGRVKNVNLGGSDSAGGYLLGQELSASIVDLARSASVSVRAGAQVVPMTTSEMALAKLSGDATATWRPESVAVPSSDILFGKITLRARTLAAIVPASIEVLEDASNAGSVIEGALRASLGLALDKAILDGNGSTAPLGILQDTNVPSIATIGLPADHDHLSNAVGTILGNDFPGDPGSLAWISHPRDAQVINDLKDTTNQPLAASPWAAGLNQFSTTSMPTTGGVGSDESSAIVGDFSQVLVGMRTTNVVVRVLSSGQVTDSSGTVFNAASQLGRLIVAHLRCDVAVLQPGWLTRLTGIKIA